MENGPARASRRRFIMRCLLVWVLACVTINPGPRAGASVDDLSEVLVRLDRASRLYLDSALKFACDETISESSITRVWAHRFNYIFVYDAKKGFDDYRTYSSRPGARSVDPASFGFRYLQRSYMWALVFHKSRQPFHHYRLEGRERLSGREVLRVTFEPLAPYRPNFNDFFGTAWVDLATFQLLRVEAMRAKDHAVFEQVQKDRAEVAQGAPLPLFRKDNLVENVTTEFGMQKNGMRFPSRTEITLTELLIPFNRPLLDRDTKVVDRTVQRYKNYHFFGVRAEGQVRDILKGKQQIAPSP